MSGLTHQGQTDTGRSDDLINLNYSSIPIFRFQFDAPVEQLFLHNHSKTASLTLPFLCSVCSPPVMLALL